MISRGIIFGCKLFPTFSCHQTPNTSVPQHQRPPKIRPEKAGPFTGQNPKALSRSRSSTVRGKLLDPLQKLASPNQRVLLEERLFEMA